jgi:ABC-type Fe3+/spermidine/putrescine transport system ATPase subunit
VGAGRPVQTVAVGQKVDCLLRPEAIRLGTPADGTGMRATVELVNFLGDSMELALDTPAGPLTARIATRPAAARPSPGGAIDIFWAAADVTVFPEAGGA